MNIEFDSEKREKTLIKHRLEMANFARIFQGTFFDGESTQDWHGENRRLVCGMDGRKLVTAFYTMRSANFRVITMRPADDEERKIYAKQKRKERYDAKKSRNEVKKNVRNKKW